VRQAAITGFDLAQGSNQMVIVILIRKSKSTINYNVTIEEKHSIVLVITFGSSENSYHKCF